MTRKDKYRVKAITRRRVLEATLAGTALVAAPPFLRRAHPGRNLRVLGDALLLAAIRDRL